MRAGKKSCHDVTQHDRLLEHLENNGSYCSQHEDKRQVTDQTIDVNTLHILSILKPKVYGQTASPTYSSH